MKVPIYKDSGESFGSGFHNYFQLNRQKNKIPKITDTVNAWIFACFPSLGKLQGQSNNDFLVSSTTHNQKPVLSLTIGTRYF